MTADLRRACAEKLGWKHYGCAGCLQVPCRCNEWISADEGPCELPAYDAEPAAALLLVEAARERGVWFTFSTGPFSVVVTFEDRTGPLSVQADITPETPLAHAFCQAVCAAYLKLP